MACPVFVSYRRDDAAADAVALSSGIRGLLGDDAVFMDTGSIRGGDSWPDVLKKAVIGAQTVIVVVGPDWVRIADQWGRRRLDQPDDWVRLELTTALGAKKKRVIPVRVRGAEVPPANALPRPIRSLFKRQSIEIRRDYFNHDVQLLLAQLRVGTSNAVERRVRSLPYPSDVPEGPEPVPSTRLQRILQKELTEWRIVESPVPEHPATTRTELHREYLFKRFQGAIGFMTQVAPGCDIANHHPRWENIWKTLRVYLTTWDIDHHISDRDIQLARYFDRAYSEFDGRARPKSGEQVKPAKQA